MRPIETFSGKTVFGGFLCCFQRDCLGPRGPRVDDDAYTNSGLECGLKDLGAQRLAAGTINEADQFSPRCYPTTVLNYPSASICTITCWLRPGKADTKYA